MVICSASELVGPAVYKLFLVMIHNSRTPLIRPPSESHWYDRIGRKEGTYLFDQTTIQYIFMKMQWSGDCR